MKNNFNGKIKKPLLDLLENLEVGVYLKLNKNKIEEIKKDLIKYKNLLEKTNNNIDKNTYNKFIKKDEKLLQDILISRNKFQFLGINSEDGYELFINGNKYYYKDLSGSFELCDNDSNLNKGQERLINIISNEFNSEVVINGSKLFFQDIELDVGIDAIGLVSIYKDGFHVGSLNINNKNFELYFKNLLK